VVPRGRNRSREGLVPFTYFVGDQFLSLVEVLSSGGGVAAAIAAALVINVRLVAYSAGLVPWFAHERRRSRMLLAWFVIDPTYVLAVDRFERDDPGPGAPAPLLPRCRSHHLPGVDPRRRRRLVAGAAIPAALELEMAATLMMVGMLASSTGRADQRLSAAIGFAIGVLGFGLPGHTRMLAAAAIAFGLALGPQGAER
jgi:predicted branched-subunit amino acid permease